MHGDPRRPARAVEHEQVRARPAATDTERAASATLPASEPTRVERLRERQDAEPGVIVPKLGL